MLIDSHCHFDFDIFANQRDTVLQQCLDAGIQTLIIPGVAPKQWPLLTSLCHQYCSLKHTLGLHPWWIDKQSAVSLDTLTEQLISNLNRSRVVGIGECGLDKNITVPLSQQLSIVHTHLEVAVEYHLPIIFHSYKAHNELLAAIDYYGAKQGVIHGFSGSIELALQYWKRGFTIGIGGTITYSRAEKTRRTVQQLPIDAIVLETDAPDMPLAGQQGKANSPLNLIKVAKEVAQLRQEPFADICAATTQNTGRVFNL